MHRLLLVCEASAFAKHAGKRRHCFNITALPSDIWNGDNTNALFGFWTVYKFAGLGEHDNGRVAIAISGKIEGAIIGAARYLNINQAFVQAYYCAPEF